MVIVIHYFQKFPRGQREAQSKNWRLAARNSASDSGGVFSLTRRRSAVDTVIKIWAYFIAAVFAAALVAEIWKDWKKAAITAGQVLLFIVARFVAIALLRALWIGLVIEWHSVTS
jgi:hypothetical protein